MAAAAAEALERGNLARDYEKRLQRMEQECAHKVRAAERRMAKGCASHLGSCDTCHTFKHYKMDTWCGACTHQTCNRGSLSEQFAHLVVLTAALADVLKPTQRMCWKSFN